jgi:hypothetical protein
MLRLAIRHLVKILKKKRPNLFLAHFLFILFHF